jgi:hypothetical protein
VELLTKVTLKYSAIEDRIRMSAQLQGKEPVVFWLTLRLSIRLVRALTGHLEGSVSSSGLIDRGFLLTCRLREAEWQLEPSEPVSHSRASVLVLPEKVDLACSEQNASLLFPLGDGRQAQLQMNFTELRQWLGIVYRQFQTAGWPMEVWPAWFMQTEPGKN